MEQNQLTNERINGRPLCFIHSKTHTKLNVLAALMFGPRSLCPLCSEAEVTTVAGRTLQKVMHEFTGPNSPTARSQLASILCGPWSSTFYGLMTSIASTTGNNVGASSCFKEILAPG